MNWAITYLIPRLALCGALAGILGAIWVMTPA